MKVIIPVAGKGTRVRPHSYSKPKPLIRVAGKRAIQLLIDQMLQVNPESFIIITDPRNDADFRRELPILYPNLKFDFVIQEEQLGTAHVILQAKDLIKEGDDIFILFCDTIFKKDLRCLNEFKRQYSGVIFAEEVEDYQRFGVITHHNNIMESIVEKPSEPISRLANIGAYYLSDGYEFMKRVKRVIDEDLRVKGELYLTEAFTLYIRDGRKIRVESVDMWLDVGKIETVLDTNAKLLKGTVYKGEDVIVEDSHLGENVAISENTIIRNCNIENSIIGANTILEGLTIKDSIIGDNVTLRKEGHIFNIGDNCTIN